MLEIAGVLTCTRLESFLLFSQDLPSQDLGFVDAKATTLELTVADEDMTIHQSPTLLSSNRAGGTTGAGKAWCYKRGLYDGLLF